jgi:hypothetical protein
MTFHVNVENRPSGFDPLNINPFLWFLLPLAALAWLLNSRLQVRAAVCDAPDETMMTPTGATAPPQCKRLRQLAILEQLLWAVLGTLLCLTFMLEIYWIRRCPVSGRR